MDNFDTTTILTSSPTVTTTANTGSIVTMTIVFAK